RTTCPWLLSACSVSSSCAFNCSAFSLANSLEFAVASDVSVFASAISTFRSATSLSRSADRLEEGWEAVLEVDEVLVCLVVGIIGFYGLGFQMKRLTVWMPDFIFICK